ncbi:MAG TPA: tRNA 2-selenouridine(34) synthase MnmH [Burkholderiales bacterium]|nr:tRNA 2-selenouridine(34) synthase MnmH [Burkholderiales bacterium]
MSSDLTAEINPTNKIAGARQAGVVTVAQMSGFDEVIDVRSPAEFAEDHLPGAINCPVLNDEERIRVGTLYKQVSPFEARKVGAALVARNIAEHLDQLFRQKPKNWRPLIYCWRGGARSGSMTQIFRQIGWDACQLDGGYKSFRRFVAATLQTLPLQFDFHVICGPTGSGKSRLLEALAAQGAQVLDLEQLAAHRGSVLGHLPKQAQPSQKMFETTLWTALDKMAPSRPVFIEAESRKIGQLRVPEAIAVRMSASRCINLETNLAARVRLLTEDYGHFMESPLRLAEKLNYLVKLHGREKISEWKTWALDGKWQRLITDLLVNHYDPAYARSTAKNYPRLSEALTVEAPDVDALHMESIARELLVTLNKERALAT